MTTSKRSALQARSGGIPLIDINTLTAIDITVDGADEINSKKRMIKGGGGALFREKIIASMSREMVVIVDSSKLVDHFGQFPLPIEIIPFGYQWIIKKLEQAGYSGTLRKINSHSLYMTDNGNYIYDIHLPNPCLDPEEDQRRIRAILGVIETGFFFKLAGRVIVGFEDGHVEIR